MKILTLLSLIPAMVLAADWPNYRGPNHSGIAAAGNGWTGKQPKVLWTVALGPGASSVVVVKDQVYTMGNKGNRDIVYCLDASTGKELWQHSYACPLDKRSFEGGPAATPTVDGDRVFTLSHKGDVFCLNAADGKVVWSKHLVRDFKGVRPDWGFAGSALVDGDLVIFDTGGDGTSNIALNKKDGSLHWNSGDEPAGYSTPVPATFGGKRALVLFKGREVVALDAATGSRLWRFPWRTSYDVNAAAPIVRGEQVFISSGYGTGSALIQNGRELWRNKNLCAMVSTPALVGDCLYGFSGNVGGNSTLTCVAWATGKTKWAEGDFANGNVIAADGKLVVLTEKGELLIAPASPEKFALVSRLQVLKERCWVAPAISNGRVFCRGNAGTLVAVDVR